jgi:uncharacterized membrane protein
MSEQSRFPAVLAYLLPFVGWLYIYYFQRKNKLAFFHLRQAVGLFLFLVGVLVGWMIIAWILAWIPLIGVVGIALFSVVMAACMFGVVAWLLGISYALRNMLSPLPVIGAWASRLPVK